jgi:hypothetical protein
MVLNQNEIKKMKVILIILLCINSLLSFYNWAIYAYNAKQAKLNISLLEKAYKKQENALDQEKIESLAQAIARQSIWETNSAEWLLKFVIDLVILVIVIVGCSNLGRRVDKHD